MDLRLETVTSVNGWHISTYRKSADRFLPASFDSDYSERLAVWQGEPGALEWLTELCSNDAGIDLGGNGYPSRITAPARLLLPNMTAGPPNARDVWVFGPHDVVDFSVWPGRTTLDDSQIKECHPDEWLLIEIWDES